MRRTRRSTSSGGAVRFALRAACKRSARSTSVSSRARRYGSICSGLRGSTDWSSRASSISNSARERASPFTRATTSSSMADAFSLRHCAAAHTKTSGAAASRRAEAAKRERIRGGRAISAASSLRRDAGDRGHVPRRRSALRLLGRGLEIHLHLGQRLVVDPELGALFQLLDVLAEVFGAPLVQQPALDLRLHLVELQIERGLASLQLEKVEALGRLDHL